MKTLLKIVGVLVVVAAAGLWFLAANIDGIVKQVIEEVGTETLATDVRLGSVKIELGGESSAALTDLTIANPDGWSAPYAFELGTIAASIQPASLSKDVIVIPDVLVEDVRLSFEQKDLNSNLQDLLDNIDSGPAEPTQSAPAPAEGDSALLAIGQVRLTNIGVTAISDQLDQPLEFTLQDVVVRDIGTAQNGVTPDQAATQLVEPLIDAVLQQSQAQLQKVLEAKVREEVDKKKDEAEAELKDSLKDKLFN